MTAYADFSNHCHASEQTPEFLFRRADLLRSAGQYQEAMTQLRDIHDHYKDFDKRPVCAFLVGFIAEVELNDREQARKTYEQVIELHPDSRAAIWSQQSIDNLNVLP
jgi:TolA-binding protein